MSKEFLEILDFKHFHRHFVFVQNEKNGLEKKMVDEIHVRVGLDVVIVDM